MIRPGLERAVRVTGSKELRFRPAGIPYQGFQLEMGLGTSVYGQDHSRAKKKTVCLVEVK